jgi:predicted Rossmann-fold nucleotide-binding protein
MPRICVFCGSQTGHHERYRQAAVALGQHLAERGHGLVYGEVDGVIPEALVGRELAHLGVTQLHVVPTMHDRKARMAELSDAFIAMPGGYGTLDELFEIITWAQLGIHQKPIGLLNVDGYFDALVALIDHAIGEGFVRPEHRHFWTLADTPDELLDALLKMTMHPRGPGRQGASDGT